MTFTELDKRGRCPCSSLDEAKKRAYQWTTWAKQCAHRRNIDDVHRMIFDDPARVITVECAGMTAAYTYPSQIVLGLAVNRLWERR
jgi:hypothetical protein